MIKTESEMETMKSKRTIEVFTAGCPICNDTLALVKNAVSSCGCEVIERRCSGKECCEPAETYGVRTMPTVVVDGSIRFEGRLTEAQTATLSQ